MKITLIGAGNLATQLGRALHASGQRICQVYSRTKENAELLADSVDARATDCISDICADADFYIFAVKDDALPDVLRQMPHQKGIWVHTAGSVPMNVFEPYTKICGVLYPLQTFSKKRDVDFSVIPVCIEATTLDVREKIELLANSVSNNVCCLTSEKRKYVHLAAVFACNFTNHLYTLAADILEKENISFDVLKPLIQETADKVKTMNPREAQTGPAVRFDEKIIHEQLQLIDDEQTKTIYSLLSNSIHTYSI